ncbi:MAG: CHC2 zinc finger domain-containing protein [bacterium]|nr:CHC2 zinc finger domain-containing protein [bacterium]
MNTLDKIERIKSKITIPDLLTSEDAETLRRGKPIHCPLPGHEDKKASFGCVKGSDFKAFNCFGCSRKGDIIQFYRDLHDCDFQTAKRALIEKLSSGIVSSPVKKTLPGKKPVNSEKLIKRSDILETITEVGYHRLWESEDKLVQEALVYFRSRRWGKRILKDLRIGLYLPGEINRLLSPNDRMLAGIPLRKIGVVPRLWYPITQQGRIHFAQLGTFRKQDRDNPELMRYLSLATGECEIGAKGMCFPTSDTPPIDSSALVCEGISDALSLLHSDFGDAIIFGALGVGLLPEPEFFKNCTKVITCFDNDPAGKDATRNFGLKLLRAFSDKIAPDISVLQIPEKCEERKIKDYSDHYLMGFVVEKAPMASVIPFVQYLIDQVIPKDSLPGVTSIEQKTTLVKALEKAGVREALALLSSTERKKYLEYIKERTGSKIELGQTVSTGERETMKKTTQPKLNFKQPCKECVENVMAKDGATNEDAAKTVVEWLTENGATFYKGGSGELFLHWQNTTYLANGNPSTNTVYCALIYELSGIAYNSKQGRLFHEVLVYNMNQKANYVHTKSFSHGDVRNNILYINPSSLSGKILKITSGEIIQVENGRNTEGILLLPSPKLKQLQIEPGGNLKGLMTGIHLLQQGFACAPEYQAVIIGWLLALPLWDFTDTRPNLRFEGSHSSGKTSASAILSSLVYGNPEEKTGTIAANWRDAAQNPLLVLDNLEVAGMSDSQINFMLYIADGTPREKSQSGSDRQSIELKPHCLFLSNGIEPFPNNRPELLSRSLTIPFDQRFQGKGFIRARRITEIQNLRDSFWSGWTALLPGILKQISEEKLDELILEYEDEGLLLGKERLRSYLAISDLCCQQVGLGDIFRRGLELLTTSAGNIAAEQHPIASALEAFFNAHDRATEIDQNKSRDLSEEEKILSRYSIRFENEDEIGPETKSSIFNGLKSFCKDRSISFPYASFQQFNPRLKEAESALRQRGFVFENTGRRSHGSPLFILRRENTELRISQGKQLEVM